ncbi:MAG: DUF998 domain-containing protein [Candidatus Aenigmatarchaeota archaeon]
MKKKDRRNVAGILIFVASAQFIIALKIAEALYPNYNVSSNYISDLGVGPSAFIFNSSVFLLGFLALISAYFLLIEKERKDFLFCLVLAGIGAMGVGIFTEDFGLLHTIFSFITFFFGALASIFSYKTQKSTFSLLFLLLGSISLISLILFGLGADLGLGKGGMERMIAYPILIWALGFGAYTAKEKYF